MTINANLIQGNGAGAGDGAGIAADQVNGLDVVGCIRRTGISSTFSTI